MLLMLSIRVAESPLFVKELFIRLAVMSFVFFSFCSSICVCASVPFSFREGCGI